MCKITLPIIIIPYAFRMEIYMRYRYLMATDMDLTLVMPAKDVSEENLRACRALKDNGVALTIATGRSSFLVDKFASKLGIDVPLITGNGSALWDSRTRQHIFSADFPPEKLKYLLSLFLKRGVDCTLYSTEGVFLCPNSSRQWFCDAYNEGLPDELKAPVYKIDESFLNGNVPDFNKFLLINVCDEIAEDLKSDPDLYVVSSGPTFYDVMASGVSKGTGLLTLADRLGIPRENTFAIGDSENDLSMIEDAAHGIAMGNSDDAILKAASYITSRCEEDGFAKAVFEYVLPVVRASDTELPLNE